MTVCVFYLYWLICYGPTENHVRENKASDDSILYVQVLCHFVSDGDKYRF